MSVLSGQFGEAGQGVRAGAARLAPGTTLPARGEVLSRNLAALRLRSAAAAAAIESWGRGLVEFGPSRVQLWLAPDGGVTGAVTGTIASPGAGPGGDSETGPRRLASARAPIAEGQALAKQVDVVAAATVVVRGLGCGHHVEAVARAMGSEGCVVVLEPDVELLRTLMERVDCSAWLTCSNVVVITDPADTAALSQGLQGVEALVACGTRVVDHPPSMARLGDAAGVFARSVETVVRAIRTNVVTTLVQMDVTVRNLLQNVRWYAMCDGIDELKDACKGRPAVVVSAGPSLARNVELLSRPGVRERVVIIAVQTVLKTLLARGIKPHYVTALDYHEISARFYEGLTREDVEGVTLVVEPKANPAILAAFPGCVRCVGDGVLDRVLGDGLLREIGPRGELRPGATVAHLAYYLARHLGCDPVLLIGQDLGFTGHQYYAPGAAIHQVWACELGEFRTLEMLEWERIARMRSLLRRAPAQGGGTIYTDEQMSTYLVQFERDFTADQALGLTTIDATEGGLVKRGTREATLLDALARVGVDALEASRSVAPELGVLPGAGPARGDGLAERVRDRVREMIASAARVASASREAGGMLRTMKELAQGGTREGEVNRLIGAAQALAERTAKEPAYWLVQHINQTGQLNRFRADRAIAMEKAAGLQRQIRQIERDIRNVQWLADASDHAGTLLAQCLEALTTGRLRTRDETVPPAHARDVESIERGSATLASVLVLEPGWERPVAGTPAFERTLARLAAARSGADAATPGEHTPIVIVGTAEEISRAATMLAARGKPALANVSFHAIDGRAREARRSAVHAARLWSRHSWRGGIANLTCYDEIVHPAMLAEVAARARVDGMLVAGASWCLVDPGLTREVHSRAQGEGGRVSPIAFTQATPGLSPLGLSRGAVIDLAAGSGPFATIGAMLGYIPIAPQADPIGKGVCVRIDPALRDVGWAMHAGDGPGVMERVLASAGEKADAATLASAWRAAQAELMLAAGAFEHVVLGAGAFEEECAQLWELLRASSRAGVEVAISIVPSRGVDPMRASNAHGMVGLGLAARAREAGAAGVHLRTALAGGIDDARALLDVVGDTPSRSLVQVVSIDVPSMQPEVFQRLAGWDGAEAVRGGIEHLLEHRGVVDGSAGLPRLWVVPRMTRRRDVLDELEPFYDRWLMLGGAAVIDAPARLAGGGERSLAPLPTPRGCLELHAARTRFIGVDT